MLAFCMQYLVHVLTMMTQNGVVVSPAWPTETKIVVICWALKLKSWPLTCERLHDFILRDTIAGYTLRYFSTLFHRSCEPRIWLHLVSKVTDALGVREANASHQYPKPRKTLSMFPGFPPVPTALAHTGLPQTWSSCNAIPCSLF